MGKLFLTSITDNVLDQFAGLFNMNPEETKVVFIPTAADPYEDKGFIESDLEKWQELGYNVTILDIKEKNEEEVSDIVNRCDVVYISGGNIFYLLEHAQSCGLGGVIRAFLKTGGIYTGGSAGAAVVGPSVEPLKTIDNPNKAKNLSDYSGLGLVDFIVLPHYDYEKYKVKFQEVIRNYPEYTYYPLNNDQTIFISGDETTQIG